MVKKQLFVLNLLSFVLATVCAKSNGLVKEFKIVDDLKNEKAENITTHLNSTNPDPDTEKLTKFTKDSIKKPPENGTLSNHSSMYTESDLEETASRDKLDGPDIGEKEANNSVEEDAREEVSSVYTESDLEATTSRDAKKNGEKDKSSAGSFLVVPHKRDVRDTEHEEGSGEGSGHEALNINIP